MIRFTSAFVLGCSIWALANGSANAAPSHAKVYANTEYVEDVALFSNTNETLLVTATRGGVEFYNLLTQKRTKHFTTQDGLQSLHVREIAIEKTNSGQENLFVLTSNHRCRLEADKFRCEKTDTLLNPEFSVAQRLANARITKTLSYNAKTIVATAGAGVWIRGEDANRLTPDEQICSNHMMAIAEFAGRTYFGSFDEGLCSTADGISFTTHSGGFRMINDLEVTRGGLFIASSEGLYRTRDGVIFEKMAIVNSRGVNGLAFDGRSLWVTTPGALWRVRVHGGPHSRTYWTPGGARSLQAVAARDGKIWIATEDRGLLQMDGETFRVFDRAAGMPASWTLDVSIAADGTVYGATLRDGIVAIDNRGDISELLGSPDTWTLFVSATKAGIDMGTQGGAANVSKENVSLIPGPPHPNVHVMSRIGSALYVGTEGGTLVVSATRT